MNESQTNTTPPTGPSTSALKISNKRQQVAQANKAIFLWVAGASVVVALSLVLLQFLVRSAIFNQDVISQKSKTNDTIVKNIDNAELLRKNVDALVADTGLASIRVNPEDSALRVILDALPTTSDTTALSNSLHSRVIGPSGIKVDSISAGALNDGSEEFGLTDVAVTTGATNSIPFVVSVTGSGDITKSTLLNIERTIRPLNVTMLDIQNSNGILATTIYGEASYLPATKVEITRELKKP